jgi:hypothetical protein
VVDARLIRGDRFFADLYLELRSKAEGALGEPRDHHVAEEVVASRIATQIDDEAIGMRRFEGLE